MSEPPTSPLVVKVGGGLLRDDGLEGLRRGCADAVALAARRPVLVVPGGGPFADAVRAVDRQLGLADDVAHVLALHAMDQLGVLLRGLLPGAELLSGLTAPRTLALLQTAPAFAGRPDVPESWTVTSDSLAVLAAAAIGAEEVVLLKSVSGVVSSWPSDEPPLPVVTARELAALQSRGGGRVVDSYLPEAVRRTGVPVVVRRPTILAEPAGVGAGAEGTRIIPG